MVIYNDYADASAKILSAPRLQEIKELYKKACAQGRWAHLWAMLTHHDDRLCDLGEVEAQQPIRSRHSQGCQAVPLAQIRGSEGRMPDFDAAFHPRQKRTRERWLSIARAQFAGIGLPAVDLVQVGDIYFVRDGHHRISVARALGQIEIDAIVTVWDVVSSSATTPSAPPLAA